MFIERADLLFAEPPECLLRRDLAAPTQNLRFGAGGFGFLDVACAIVKQRQACPGNLIVRTKCHGFFSRFDRFDEAAELHQRHTERVPAVEKSGIDLSTMPVFFDSVFQIAYSKITVRVVKNFLERLFH